MSNYKVGNKVVCVDNSKNEVTLTIGKVYELINLNDNYGKWTYPSKYFRPATLLEKELANV